MKIRRISSFSNVTSWVANFLAKAGTSAVQGAIRGAVARSGKNAAQGAVQAAVGVVRLLLATRRRS